MNWVPGKDLVLLEFLASLDPAGDAGGEVLHVLEAQCLSSRCAFFVGIAGGAAAVSHHEGVFLGLGQLFCKRFCVLEGNGTGNTAALLE